MSRISIISILFWLCLLPVSTSAYQLKANSQSMDSLTFENLYRYSTSPDREIQLPDHFSKGKEAISIIKKIRNNNFFIAGLLIILIIIIYIKIASPEYFQELLNTLIKTRGHTGEAQQNRFLLNNTLLDIAFILSFSLFFYYFLWEKLQLKYTTVLITISLFYLAQSISSALFYYVFYGSVKPNIHMNNLLWFNRAFIIIFHPLLFVSIYLPKTIQSYAFSLILILLAILIAYRSVRIYSELKNAYPFSLLYNFIYLCVFEISLYFIFIKEFGWFI